jgi:hypothetical protein
MLGQISEKSQIPINKEKTKETMRSHPTNQSDQTFHKVTELELSLQALAGTILTIQQAVGYCGESIIRY